MQIEIYQKKPETPQDKVDTVNITENTLIICSDNKSDTIIMLCLENKKLSLFYNPDKTKVSW